MAAQRMNIIFLLKCYLRDARYCIGFVDSYRLFEPVDYQRVHWLDLNGYSDGWFADPFIIASDKNTITVLAEEWFYPINRGRISKLTIDKADYRLLDVKPALQLETHLSFPYYIVENGTVYVCPENQQSSSVILYEYDFRQSCLINPVKLVDKPLMDVQILSKDGVYYLMGVEYRTGEQIDTNTLQIFTSDSLFGPYEPYHVIISDSCDKRGAGQIFEFNNSIIRPSQCCDNNEYGTAVIFNELNITGTEFVEKEIARITRNKSKRNGYVLHTFNQYNDITVIDGWDFTHFRIGRFAEMLRKFVRRYLISDSK